MRSIIREKPKTDIDHHVKDQGIKQAFASMHKGVDHADSYQDVKDAHANDPTGWVCPTPRDDMPNRPDGANDDTCPYHAVFICEAFREH